MSSNSHLRKQRDTLSPPPRNYANHRLSHTAVLEDVAIPAHLLRATGNSVRRGNSTNSGHDVAWEPQGPVTVDQERGIIGRSQSILRRERMANGTVGRSTTGPTRPNRVHVDRKRSRRRSDTTEGYQSRRNSTSLSPNGEDSNPINRHLSWLPGEADVISVRSSARTSVHEKARPTNKNPFDSTYSDSDSNPFATRSNSLSRSESNYSKEESGTHRPENAYVPPGQRPRKGTLESIVDHVVPDTLARKLTNASFPALQRRGTVWSTYEKAKTRGVEMQRQKWAQVLFEWGIYVFLLCFVYFVLIGQPLWKGAVWWLYWVVENKFVFEGGFSITLGIAFFYAFAPLLILFEKDPPPADPAADTVMQDNVKDTALLIPCYKSAGLIAATLEAALKIFPPEHIFVLANGNSETPLDNTEEICQPYGVNHLWCPIGSKIVAQFVGCYAAKAFKNVLLIDDDCALPDNFPVVTDRLQGRVMCVGYTIKSVGPNSSKGNLCQQAQDLEYKLSGIQRAFAGKIGSATFPHGAIALWDRDLLVKTFHEHPGFSVSEDWFFGHVARKLGSRIKMCTQVFVETETPTAVFFSGGGSRGGFGEMTIFSQRFKRWNFFFVNGMYYDMAYILGSWKLGWWEIGAKIFVFQEVYETLLYLLTPFVLPISFIVRPSFAGYLLAATVVMYLINTVIFNEVHLRRKNERLGWVLVYVYYLPYKIVLTGINVASCYWSLYKYARYFAKRHPKVTEDEKAVEVIVRLEEDQAAVGTGGGGLGRHMTVRTMRTRALAAENANANTNVNHENEDGVENAHAEGIATVDYAALEKTASIREQNDPFRDSRRTSLSESPRDPEKANYSTTHTGNGGYF